MTGGAYGSLGLADRGITASFGLRLDGQAGQQKQAGHYPDA
jgi:hypothetical protein